MAIDARRLFGGVGKAAFAGRDPTFNADCSYLLQVESIECFETRDPTKGGATFYKTQFRILESNDEALKKGMFGAHLIDLTKTPALGDVRMLAYRIYRALAKAAGKDPDEVKSEEFDETHIIPLYQPDQPARGIKLGLRTHPVGTKKDGWFTQHTYEDFEGFEIPSVQVKTDTSVKPSVLKARKEAGMSGTLPVSTATPPANNTTTA